MSCTNCGQSNNLFSGACPNCGHCDACGKKMCNCPKVAGISSANISYSPPKGTGTVSVTPATGTSGNLFLNLDGWGIAPEPEKQLSIKFSSPKTEKKCPDCKGRGRITLFVSESDCTLCHGTGKVLS